jgi:hypothetical protein
MREFLRNGVHLTLITLAFVITFPDSMRQIFGSFNSLGFVPVCMAMAILALLPGRLSSKAPYLKVTLAASQDYVAVM